MRLALRNECEEFAKRTKKNFEHIEQSKEDGKDVHVVTQLANSLLGLVVFPWEKEVENRMEEIELRAPSWPQWGEWEVTVADCHTLADLIKRLRNAIAHAHILFDSDSPDLDQVVFEFEDWGPKGEELVWRARIRGTELQKFCLQFVAQVLNTVE